ncbi:MAG TPA: exosortase E/protease, VPEID-CTERM system, partial [Polyangiaceae bacterium]|nr:exosortase E/protease, VPEID-CTERM system [Polyangiaceae bacterium]
MGLLLLEYALVALRFDGGELWRRGGWLSRFSSAGEVFTAAIVIATAAVLLNARALRGTLAACALSLTRPSLAWLLAHFGAFALSVAATSALFAASRGNAVAITLLVVAGLAALCALFALLRALFGEHAEKLGRALLRAAATGAGLGILAWFLGVQTRPLWHVLAQVTLSAAASLLRLASQHVIVDAPSAALGVGSFEVTIAPECSGIEGMALVAVFLGGYVYRFREELRVRRALLLVVVAVALAWVANVMRIAALVSVGAWLSPAVALGGFHSKAGWVLSCALSLSLIFALHRSRLFARNPSRAESGGEHDNPTARYCVPFLSVAATGLVSGLWLTSELDELYGLRVVAGMVALWVVARSLGLTASALLAWLRPASLTPLAWGAAIFGMWLALAPRDAALASELRAELVRLPGWRQAGWLALRLVGAIGVAPIVEELAFRGFLQRRLAARDFIELEYQKVPAWGVLGSALAFGALHTEWLLGTVAGVAYSLASMRRGRLSDAV